LNDVYITGDVHFDKSINRLVCFNNKKKSLTKDDYLIVAGDFGLIWHSEYNEKEKYLIKLYNDFNFTTVFVPGNHENFNRLYSNEFEDVVFNGAECKKISDSIYMVKHGEVLYIGDKKIFCFGGADSVDKHLRTEGTSWWREEIPSYLEEVNGYKNLIKNDFKVNYVVTHTVPRNYILEYRNTSCPVTRVLQNFEERIDYKGWFCGHYHVDFTSNKKIFYIYTRVCQLP
jgi:DNA repair exonuclease SbcCD nuclease subunit